MFESSAELRTIDEALESLLSHGAAVGSAREASELIRAVESCTRRLRAVQIEAQAEVEAAGVYATDGFASAKALTRHCARLSPAGAAVRERGARMATLLPLVRSALQAGELGVDQFDLLGRVHSNRRVREHMVDAQEWFLRIASRLSFADFEAELRDWERFADEDGPEPRNSISDETRNVSLLQDKIDLSWGLAGSFAALQGRRSATSSSDTYRPSASPTGRRLEPSMATQSRHRTCPAPRRSGAPMPCGRYFRMGPRLTAAPAPSTSPTTLSGTRQRSRKRCDHWPARARRGSTPPTLCATHSTECRSSR